MEYVELNKIPNYDFDVTATLTGVLGNKIVLGGGCGFTTPLINGGTKVLDTKIRLLELKHDEWFLLDEVELELNYSKYGFSNGASFVIDENTMYYFGGLKFVDGKVLNSKDVIEIKVIGKTLNYIIHENVLPFEGEVSGTLNQGYGYILSADNLYKINFNDFVHENDFKEFHFSKIGISENINGALIFSNSTGVYLLGGYKPYDGLDINRSNLFYESRIIKVKNNLAYKSSIKNFETDPPIFFGSTALNMGNNKIMIIGGVNKDVFLNAILNFSILKDEELNAYKKKYFGMSADEFKFNKEIFILDLNTFKLETLGAISHGLAGTPSIIKYNNRYYILNGETKAGVRLTKPLKLIY